MKTQMHPCLWFDGQARAAADFYCTIFPDSKVINDNGMVVNFELNGQLFMGLNGGDNFKFNEAVSFVIPCKDQEEIDYYWNKLTADGGKEGRCGWCKDKFGLSWQVVPTVLSELMSNPEKGQRVAQAFMKMNKFDIAALQNA
ncbi:putative 3-demethylubiquinone-9 3-methyltransferase (glyoxalase superfamily) [Chitinophaga dinghuensis]|uniref:Putative 3-demethylubiquinone-9 3-methyltransferase (Glyoxalase superfamily) n=1 Tax=Chitinophaga dinghuensis TaxID=1539050 RepID=A0A327W2U0_9BACT|nr:VOC family protein [Chitinophaga dinghuensis]RAJ83601.1 putative 3-demethylubiquinone-9 3-methyltransferase (glyoxalase superfamily) [Chitinophaga dinghuensis]